MLNRLTITVNDVAEVNQIERERSKILKFDLIAIKTSNDKAFQAICKEAKFDIIALDISQRLPFALRATTLNAAFQRGVHMELCLGGLVRDSLARRNTIFNCMNILRMTGGKNVLISSGSRSLKEFRDPLDWMSLCHLFGMKLDDARRSFTICARSVILHAYMRRKSTRGIVALVDKKPSKSGVKRKVDEL